MSAETKWTKRHPAIENLTTCQRQLDMDGCEVGVSRQAVDETLTVTAAIYEALEEAVIQLEYLHGKFQETSSGNAVLARARAALSLARGGRNVG